MMMSYQLYGNQTSLWRSPKTERDGFWESVGRVSKTGLEPGVPSDLKPNVTVCKGVGVCTYENVQNAVNAAPDNLSGKQRFVILIKEGVYKEIVRIGLAKRNVMLIGEGIGKTVITGSLNVGHLGITTYNTATVGVVGDGFMARDLTIQNTAGPGANQAVAFRSGSDLSVVENCEFIGNQDTLYAHSLRQLYKSCIIQGNVDFIFGSSASVFHNCTILIRPRQLDPMKGGNSVISAHGRMDPAQTAGFVFQECVVTGTKEYMQLIQKVPRLQQTTFLGRPWKEFSRCVYVRCKLDAIVSPLGWLPWDGDFALSTLYFGEFGNTGLGSNLSERVSWSSRTPSTHVDVYSVKKFIQGVLGDGFMARDLTIQNTAGAGAHQAVAFLSDSDLSVVENCEFLGHQDTLYAHSLRHFYKSCIIQGNIDFIFGNSAAVFHNCTILIRPRQLDPMKGGNSIISAHGRQDPAQTAGYVFQEYVITGNKEYMDMFQKDPKLHKTAFLGRPWKEYSRCVFVKDPKLCHHLGGYIGMVISL
nr:probable pectinesterase/pectinesterase inhibitor 51 [Tanacetum cinerariifolium]